MYHVVGSLFFRRHYNMFFSVETLIHWPANESVSILVCEMGWLISTPDFSIPRNLLVMLQHFWCSTECCNKRCLCILLAFTQCFYGIDTVQGKGPVEWNASTKWSVFPADRKEWYLAYRKTLTLHIFQVPSSFHPFATGLYPQHPQYTEVPAFLGYQWHQLLKYFYL